MYLVLEKCVKKYAFCRSHESREFFCGLSAVFLFSLVDEVCAVDFFVVAHTTFIRHRKSIIIVRFYPSRTETSDETKA